MAQAEAIATFCSVTDASPDVAQHVLEAMGWDLDAAVSFYLEGGGVGYGYGTHAGGGGMAGDEEEDVAELIEELDSDVQEVSHGRPPLQQQQQPQEQQQQQQRQQQRQPSHGPTARQAPAHEPAIEVGRSALHGCCGMWAPVRGAMCRCIANPTCAHSLPVLPCLPPPTWWSLHSTLLAGMPPAFTSPPSACRHLPPAGPGQQRR